MLAAVRRKPFVFEVRDLWPASIVAVGAMKESRVIRMLEKLELFLYRRARRVVTVTHAFKRDLVERGIDAEKIDVVLNGVDLARYSPLKADDALKCEHDLEGKFVVGYIGTHGMAHALDKVLDAAEQLQTRDDIVFLFVGAGAAKTELEARARERQLTNVRFVPRQPKESMPDYWSLCDLALIPLRDNPVFESVIPSKMFECMAMGIPVLHGVEGESADLVRTHQVGLLFEPEDGVMPFPGWEPFDGPNSADLDEEARTALAAAAVPVPVGVARGVVRLRDERRFDVPVTVVCPEFTAAQAREWIDGGDVPELAHAKHVDLVDLDSGHWPMFSRPAELARTLSAVAAGTSPA
jgi:glycosyltransferase involved in cell wall biosynthesis